MSNEKISTLKVTLAISTFLALLKFSAYYFTHSNAVLTDALESIINVVAGAFALFSVWLASLPKDDNHPYGHGKIEFISAGFEGGLIAITGIYIIIKSIYNFFHPITIHQIDWGIILTVIAGCGNYFIGKWLLVQGKKHNSSAITADGKHLLTDTFSSIALLVGLILIYFTKIYWIDNLLAIGLGVYIILSGYKILRQSVSDLLDEADYEKLHLLINVLNTNRDDKWIDMHNLRVLKYGHHLHVDCHITLPWYLSLDESHQEVSAVENLIKENIQADMEFFIHSDPCIMPTSCQICPINNCKERKAEFVKRLNWNMENLLPDKKHKL